MPILNINEDGHLISCVPEGPDDNGSVVLSSEVKSIAPDAFDTYRNDIVEICGDTSAELPKGFLRNSSKLQRVNLPNVLKMGADCFFYCSALASVELPALTEMGYGCFNYCSALDFAKFPALTTMGNQCFYGCSALVSVELLALTAMGYQCFYGCSALGSVGLLALTAMGSQCFYGCNLDILKIFISRLNHDAIKAVLGDGFHNCIIPISKERWAFLVCCAATKNPTAVTAAVSSAEDSLKKCLFWDCRLTRHLAGHVTSPYGGNVVRFL